MVEETKVTEEVTTKVTPPEPTAEVVTPPETAEKKFTQQDVDKFINTRLAREKAAFEKQLAEQKTAIEQEQTTKYTELETQLAEKDKKITRLFHRYCHR